jgi:GGDEF domain-containing protein
MISIRGSLSELDRAHEIREAALGCYVGAIKNCAHYSLDLDAELTGNHRQYLRRLAEEIAAGDDQTLQDSSGTLRNLLRDYRDKGSQYLANLRDELANTVRALEATLDSLSQSDGEHEAKLRITVKRLRELAAAPRGATLGTVLRGAAESIEQTVEQIHKQHQLTVAQFQIELRMLHQRIDTLEAAATIDELTRFYNREETAERIKTVTTGEYCLLLVSARGLRRAEMQWGSVVSEELAGAFAKRLRNSLPSNAVLGRWSTEELVAMLPMKKAEALVSAKWITEHLSGTYACLLDGKTVRPALQLNVGVVDTSPGETAERVLERLGTFLTGS